ncbi:hypothetical protein [Actinocorallia libanotica]|uniref:Uncharacterized protein n=1 Tax=Actinocorallia libanotica TaxID=46162 RepID=A0ABN1Q129_9ACTN
MSPSYFKTPECDHSGRVLWIPPQFPGHNLERLAEWHNRVGRAPHLIWDAETGEIIEMIAPGHRNALFSPEDPLSEMYAIEVVPQESEPFTGSPHLSVPLALCEGLCVPRSWPLGPPESYARYGSRFTKPGHYGAEQVSSKLGAIGPVDTNAFRRTK